jgi:hypothetical protein
MAKRVGQSIPSQLHCVLLESLVHQLLLRALDLKLRFTTPDDKLLAFTTCKNVSDCGIFTVPIEGERKIQTFADEPSSGEREEEERRQAELERCRWEEQQRIEKLDRQMSDWKRAREVRAYAAAVEEFAVRHYGKLDRRKAGSATRRGDGASQRFRHEVVFNGVSPQRSPVQRLRQAQRPQR